MLYFVGHKGHCWLCCNVVKDPSKCIYFFPRQAKFGYNYLFEFTSACLSHSLPGQPRRGAKRTGEQTNKSNCFSPWQSSWPHPTDIQDDVCGWRTTALPFPGFFLISSVFPSQISSPIWFVGQAQSRAGQPAGELAAPPQLSAPLQVHSWGWCCHLIKMLHLYSNKKSYLPSGFPLVLPLLSVHGGLTQLRWEAGNSLGRKISSYPMGIPHLSQIQPLAASFEGSGQKTLISGLWCWHKCFWLLHTPWPGTEIASRNLNMQEMWST